MRKKLIALVGAALILTGCSAPAPVADPSPSPTPLIDDSASASACRAFYTTFTNSVSEIQGVDRPKDRWDDLAAEVDRIGLSAEGDVKERMLAFAAGWPEVADVFLWNDYETTNAHLASIERACVAAGEDLKGLQLGSVD